MPSRTASRWTARRRSKAAAPTRRRTRAHPSPAPEQPASFLHSPPDSNGTTKTDESDSTLSDIENIGSDGAPPTNDTDDTDPPSTKEDAEAQGVEMGKPQDVVEMSEAQDVKMDEAPGAPKVKEEEEQEGDGGDIGEIEPHDWSGAVPIFKPTMHQFKDFKTFMERINKYGMKSGIVKIIPPAEWRETLPPIDDLIKQIRVREPIKQDIMGSNGTYRQVNILHQRSYNLPQWRSLCDQSEHQPPARRGERRANVVTRPRASAARARPEPSTPKPTPTKRRGGKGGRAAKRVRISDDVRTDPSAEGDQPITPVSPKPAGGDLAVSVEADGGEEEEERNATPVVGRMGAVKREKTQSVSARRKYSRREGSAAIDEEAFRNWDYRIDVSDYTPERCEELERIYWKTLTYAPPLYGADLMGTLFHEDTKQWNLNRLPNLLDALGTQVPGVNTAYLYLGMWKATFAWHLEDVDLYSINYLHFGAPKQWYSISQADARRFEAAMKNIWPTEAKACDQFLRHKAFLISPQNLQNNFNIKVNRVVSYPGEFVVTYPYGYHSGYNLGYNCAEAVNFALDSWLPMGKIAKRCECVQAQDSVWVDVYEIERKLRGEETDYEQTDEDEDEDEDEEDEEEEEDEEGSHDDSSLLAARAAPRAKIAVSHRKRRRTLAAGKDGKGKPDKVKRPRKIKIRIKPRPNPPCCLCPNDFPSMTILDTDDGRKVHRQCALYLPEPFIDTIDGKEVIVNLENVPKARIDLKCLYCRSKKGACLQCSQQKCTRSYHATCAAMAGVFVEDTEVPVFGDDGTEYKERAFEFSCRFHRTRRDKKLDGAVLENDERICDAARAANKGDVCQFQFHRGEIYAGIVVENRKSEETLLLDILPHGDRMEVEWKWLIVPDPSDYHLPKASANAIPLPPTKKAQDALNAKRSGDESQIPRKGDVFVDGGFTWAEFHTCDDIVNKDQVNLHLDQPEQVWLYLPAGSTEGRPQYTHDPAVRVHNKRSNYLDTLPKPAKPLAVFVPRRKDLALPAPPRPGAAATPTPLVNNEHKPYVYKPRKTEHVPASTRAALAAGPTTAAMFASRLPATPTTGLPQWAPQTNYAPLAVALAQSAPSGRQPHQAHLAASSKPPATALQKQQQPRLAPQGQGVPQTPGLLQALPSGQPGQAGLQSRYQAPMPQAPQAYASTWSSSSSGNPASSKDGTLLRPPNTNSSAWSSTNVQEGQLQAQLLSPSKLLPPSTGGVGSPQLSIAGTKTPSRESPVPVPKQYLGQFRSSRSTTPTPNGSAALPQVASGHPQTGTPVRPPICTAQASTPAPNVSRSSTLVASVANAAPSSETAPPTTNATQKTQASSMMAAPIPQTMRSETAVTPPVPSRPLGRPRALLPPPATAGAIGSAPCQPPPQQPSAGPLKVTPVPLPRMPGFVSARSTPTPSSPAGSAGVMVPRSEAGSAPPGGVDGVVDGAAKQSVDQQSTSQGTGKSAASSPSKAVQTPVLPPQVARPTEPAQIQPTKPDSANLGSKVNDSKVDGENANGKGQQPSSGPGRRPPHIQTQLPASASSTSRSHSQASTPAITPTFTPTLTPTHPIQYQFSPQPAPQMRPRPPSQTARPQQPPQAIPPHVMVPPYPFNMPDSQPRKIRPVPDQSVIDPSLMTGGAPLAPTRSPVTPELIPADPNAFVADMMQNLRRASGRMS